MENRARQILGLSKKRNPLTALNPNLPPKKKFHSTMDKCQRFLNNLRTPAEMRTMSSQELGKMDRMYDEEEDNVEVAEDALVAKHVEMQSGNDDDEGNKPKNGEFDRTPCDY